MLFDRGGAGPQTTFFHEGGDRRGLNLGEPNSPPFDPLEKPEYRPVGGDSGFFVAGVGSEKLEPVTHGG